MSGLSASPFGNAHADVLEAKPATAEAKAALLAEIKERAKKCFVGGQMPVCEVLYSKALELAPEAAVHANRSAVRLALGRHADAVVDAKAAISLDAAYAKGYYRLGQASEKVLDFAAAVAAYVAGQALEPALKVWPAAAAKAQAKLDASALAPAPGPAPAAAHYNVPARSREETEAASTARLVSKVAKADLRGYKVNSQGRKTTFFNNELDAQTRALIGDITPKKLEAEVKMQVKDGSSAWNQAGTFEAKDHTKYVQEFLKAKFEDFMVDLPDRDLHGTTVPRFLLVKALTEFKGDASTAQARGKKKYVVDISFALEWEFALDDKGSVAKGTAKFPDVSCDLIDDDEALDFQLEVDPLTPPEAAALINSHVKKEDCGLRPAVFRICADLVRDFRATK